MITLSQFLKVAPKAENPQKIVDALNKNMPLYGIKTKEEVSMFVAQCAHESGGFTAVQENLNYSADGLANTWPNRYAKKDAKGNYIKNEKKRNLPNDVALRLHRNPEAIANNCYANRMSNGDEKSGDGWKYRGRGYKQLTGRANYEMFERETGMKVVSNPDLLLQPDGAVISACWFWKKNNLSQSANKKDIATNTKIINGGTLGLEDRTAKWNTLYKEMTA